MQTYYKDPVGKPFDPGFFGWLIFEEAAGWRRRPPPAPLALGLSTVVLPPATGEDLVLHFRNQLRNTVYVKSFYHLISAGQVDYVQSVSYITANIYCKSRNLRNTLCAQFYYRFAIISEAPSTSLWVVKFRQDYWRFLPIIVHVQPCTHITV